MLESKNMGNLNAHIQGSVWIWKQGYSSQFASREGVQSSGRPVLIISNNTFNQWSPSVNCLTITSVLKNSPVHVEITLDVVSHVQCEQVHTISKSELTEYKGVIPAITLSNVKEKIKIQYDMNTDRSLEILTEIKNSLDRLDEQAADGFGLQALTGEVSNLLVNTHNCFEYIKSGLAKIQGRCQESIADNMENTETPAINYPPANDGKTKRGAYSDEDIEFIIDESHSTDEVMRKFGFKSKAAAYSARSYYKRKHKGQEHYIGGDDGEHKEQSKHRSYTDEDIRFILDKSNSVSAIMSRFNYNSKATAYKMRSYFKKKDSI